MKKIKIRKNITYIILAVTCIVNVFCFAVQDVLNLHWGPTATDGNINLWQNILAVFDVIALSIAAELWYSFISGKDTKLS